MNVMVVTLLAGAVAATATLLLLVGYRSLRTDALDTLAVEDLDLLRGQQRRRAEGTSPLQRLARRLVPRLRRLLGPRRLAALQKRVDEAGRPDGLTVDGLLERIAWWFVLMLPLAVVFVLQGNLLYVPLVFAAPAVLPLSQLARSQRLRREQIDRDLPDFLDVLAVTVMAGVSFRQALARVSERFDGALGEEVQLTLHQITNGASVRDALVALRQRSSSEPVGQFVSALLQSQELGAPLAQSLKQIAQDMRRDSGQRQRQAASRMAPRVTLVTSLVLVPASMIFIFVGLWVGADIDVGSLTGGLGG
ncbi:type II secretion system F family protein [Cellulomonas xiejunii]|uniref:Type II secretion system F family protein n=1 Tax=Cellulomonas xiejunii TaxID=2968083 RepID=A0ABY5KJP8_9CELL|nr:type II secretion system F family protein [Cellulomonas xiejunii]MCC2312728.1 type II secretion system F family protein [Cellulomonas xiejunii]MCC2320402.1 type II secretion system F family protein [Cellulomonas xiejunii]UUI70699.1 type II secretion system F family protein [Cellulomonas xiejunii]